MTIYRAGSPRDLLACPRDGSRLEPRSAGGLQLQHCARCRGVWIEAAELVRLHADALLRENVADDEIAFGGRSPETLPDESLPIRCCVCGRAAHRHEYGRDTHVHVDTCKDHGLWLDGGELFAIVYSLRAGRLVGPPAVSTSGSFFSADDLASGVIEVAFEALLEGILSDLF